MTQEKNSIKVGNNFKWFLGICAVLLVIAIGFLALKPANIPEGYLSPDEIQIAIDSEVANAIEIKDVEIADLVAQLAEEIEETMGHLIDGLFLETPFGDIFSDRELNLFDGKVEFDGDDYDAEETFTISNFMIQANQDDFLGNPYLVIPEGAIKYLFTFEDDLKTSEIEDDETLVFNFLGKEAEVSEWSDGKITFSQGEEYFLEQGESVTIDGKVVLLDMVLNNAVYVTVDGVGEKIYEGKTKEVNGIEIKVSEVLYSGYAGGYQKAELVIGNNVEVSVENEDEYEKDSIWEWFVGENSFGLVLIEEFEELDEEYKPLASGESICLPNDYVCVRYNGLIEEDFEEYTLELDMKDDSEYVEVKGNFIDGINDYSRIYINSTGIYDKDLVWIETEVELGDTDSILKLDEGMIVINDFEVNMDLDVANANEYDISSKDENFLTDYGILIENPEDSCEDQYFKIEVPEEKLESTFTVY